MAKYTINDTTLTSIADAIRAKGGTTAALTPAQMAEAIAAIQAGGGGGFKTGTFTPAQSIAVKSSPQTINHGLGAMPNYIALWQDIPFTRTDERTKNEIYAIIASAQRAIDFYQSSNTSYSDGMSECKEQDWTAAPSTLTARAAIGNVNENSFTIGSSNASICVDSVTYRWVVV